MGANGEKQERERQAALNQALRREVNERRPENGEGAEVVRFVCECSDPACEELVSLTIDEYEFIRRIPIRLVVRPGHVHHESERVLMEEPGRFPCCREVRAGRGSDCAPRPPRARRADGPVAKRFRLQPGAGVRSPFGSEDSVLQRDRCEPDLAGGTLTSARQM